MIRRSRGRNIRRDLSDDERDESPMQKLDRNWLEILQELRMLQTGVQILTGFLLILPFQPRFDQLDTLQRSVYLALVLLAALTTAVLLTSVSLHRAFFRRHIRKTLVTSADLLLRLTLILLGLVLIGTTGLIFDLVLGRTQGALTALCLGLVMLGLWAVTPLTARARNSKQH